jgi:hypothetical protein
MSRFKLALAGVLTGTATVVALCVAPAAQASALPSDCSQSNVGYMGIAVTCTQRPADQTWWAYVICPAYVGKIADGNHVVGDGTSTATCPVGAPLNDQAGFFTPS